MKKSSIKAIGLLLLMALLVTACGQKGPLRQPDKAPEQAQKVTFLLKFVVATKGALDAAAL